MQQTAPETDSLGQLVQISPAAQAKEAPRVQDRIDWPAFLARHDPVWTEKPRAWEAGAFLGNGLLGAMIYAIEKEALHWDVGRSDVTDRWKDATIHNMLAEGAFLVSASRRDGQTRFIQIHSLAGAPCRVHTDLAAPIVASGDRTFTVKTENAANGERVLTIDLRKGETVLLTSGGAPAPSKDLVIAPVAAQPEHTNSYGLRK
jgi:hypothetical protein